MTRKLFPLRRIEGGPDAMSDRALLAACATGDMASLGTLFDRYADQVYRFLGRCRGAEQLDDLVQATFLEAHRAARRFRGDAMVRTWLFAIAANVARHHVRAEVRRKAGMLELASHVRSCPPPEDELQRREILQRLRQAVLELPHDIRVVFVMCELEEVRGVDAARALGIREGTLWRRLHEARLALRALLDEGGP